MTERLKDKLAMVASLTGELTGAIEARADALIARKASLEAKAHATFDAHESMMALTEQGLNQVEAALRQLSNSPPAA